MYPLQPASLEPVTESGCPWVPLGSWRVHFERSMFPPGAQVGFKLLEERPVPRAAEVEVAVAVLEMVAVADVALVVDF